LLIGDLVSGNDRLIRALVAHIVSAKPDGSRGDAVRSPLLVDDIRNLMLLCYEHHRFIDVEDEAGHPEDLLLAMKAAHETRIEIQTSLTEDRQTYILTFGAPIGALEVPLSYPSVRMTVLPERYPAGGRAIHLDIKGCQYRDHEPAYWTFQRENLGRKFRDRIAGRIETGEIRHLSVFGLAPQPLLIELGRLLCDICPADVHQLKREPGLGPGWRCHRLPDELKLLSRQGCRPEAGAERHRHRRSHPPRARARRSDLVHHCG
jgi:SMODS-associated and fused to various effectors sensor domain